MKDALKAKNMKISEVGNDKIRERAIQAVEANKAFMEAATEAIEAERKAASKLTVDLG